MKEAIARAVLALLLACPSAWAEPSARDLASTIRQSAVLSDIHGGLIVDVRCGQGELITALGDDGSYVVQGLGADPANVEKARSRIRSLGLGGRVSARELSGWRLPYVDNLVNVLVCDDPGQVPMAEMMRVLRPGGIVILKQNRE